MSVNLPNALTLLRIFIVPILVAVLLTPFSENWLGVPRHILGVSIFLAAALTKGMGVSNVLRIDPLMVSEDFGRFGLDHQIPLCMINLGAVDPAPSGGGTRSSGPPPDTPAASAQAKQFVRSVVADGAPGPFGFAP